MVGGRSERGSRRHAGAASVVVPFPRGAAGARLDLVRFVPSGRSLLVTFGTLVAIGLGYWIAYSTPVFAVDAVEIRGAPPALEGDVRAATRDLVGTSLVSVDADDVESQLRTLPAVAGVSVDRAFPSTLVVKIAPERPVAVIRGADAAWLATGDGKVIREIRVGTQRGMPRLWVRRGATIRVGGQIPAGLVSATRALAAAHAAGIASRVKGVRTTGEELTLVLRRGLEIRLGRPADVGMKLVIARKVLGLVGNGTSYIDVSVPQRPVAS
jgi:cell division septal protein FtsQ